MKRFIRLSLLLTLVATALPGFAAGFIVVHDSEYWPGPRLPRPILPPRPIPMPPPRPVVWAPLEVSSFKATSRITDQIATTTIEEEFFNPNAARLEGTFMFPVPKHAHLDKFTMEIDGKPVEAELMSADKARQIYEDIVRSVRDPALLEFAGRDMFKVRVFPIEPRSRKRLTLSYSQLLRADAGLVSYVLPMNTAKFSAAPLKSVSVKVELDSKHPLKAIYSPSHKVEIRREAKHATIGFEANDVKPDADFHLIFSRDEGELGVNLLAHKNAGEEGYFLLFAAPGLDEKEKKVAPKDVAFVLDTSGSMAGAKLEQAKKALLFCVENLNSQDRFEIVRFSTEVEMLFDKLTDASSANRSKARDFIKELKPIGGTAIDDALKRALTLKPDKSERPFVVIFLTDGMPTVGVTNEDEIVANARQRSGGLTRVFCFGIGTDVNTRLLDRITEETRAFSQYVLPEEDIEVKVSSFFTKIKDPALAGMKIIFPEGARVTKLYPYPLPDLFKGEQLVLVGHYSGKASGKVVIEGTVNGEARKFSYDLALPDEARDHEFIPRLWATRRVGYLLDEIRLRGESAELKDEITELARRYGIVTPYTAYLIVEDEMRRNIPADRRTMLRLQEDREALRQAGEVYERFSKDTAGNAAVAGAQSSFAFKQADTLSEALALGVRAAERAYSAPAPAGPTSAGGGFGGFAGKRGSSTPALVAATAEAKANKRVVEYSQQSRFVAGKTFFQNGEQWVDAEAQKKSDGKRVRVQFSSPEYFDLLAKNPSAAAWLSLGRNVQFVLGEVVYEIYE